MPLNDIGPRGYVQNSAVATLSYTPQYDRAGIVKRVLIDKPSAADVWRVTCGGKELAAFDVQVLGNQQPLAGPYSGFPKTNDLFKIVEEIFSEPMQYPVPQGETFTVASDGGATANVEIAFQEVAPGELSPGMANHPAGHRLILPLVGYRAAAIAAAGDVAFDTQVGPRWLPNLFADGILPPNFTFRVFALFLEGGGVNTFSGAADHRSVSAYISVRRNGQLLFTRAAAGGIPLIGQASAAGSANTVQQTDETPLPPVQEVDWFDWSVPDRPLIFGAGDSYQLRLNVTGDVTGGADYSHMRQLFLCDVQTP